MTVDAASLASDTKASAQPATPSLALSWYVLIMMCLVYTLSIADRYVISTVLEPIKNELQLTDTQVNLLTGIPLVGVGSGAGGNAGRSEKIGPPSREKMNG